MRVKSVEMWPLPKKIEDDVGCIKSKCETSVNDRLLLDKLSDFVKVTKSVSMSKQRKHLLRRAEFVLNHDHEDRASLQQMISLNLEDSYVTFGFQKDAGKLASAKTSALVLTEKCRQAIEDAAPGDKKLEIKPKLGKKASKKAKKAEREKTKGDAWYGMPATEMTDEVKRDLEVLQMRGALDPKRFYKKSSNKELPKYFQVGHYVDTPADFYIDKSSKKLKNKTLVDELMADAEFRKYNKRKYTEIIEEKEKHLPKKDRKNFAKKHKVK